MRIKNSIINEWSEGQTKFNMYIFLEIPWMELNKSVMKVELVQQILLCPIYYCKPADLY